MAKLTGGKQVPFLRDFASVPSREAWDKQLIDLTGAIDPKDKRRWSVAEEKRLLTASSGTLTKAAEEVGAGRLDRTFHILVFDEHQSTGPGDWAIVGRVLTLNGLRMSGGDLNQQSVKIMDGLPMAHEEALTRIFAPGVFTMRGPKVTVYRACLWPAIEAALAGWRRDAWGSMLVPQSRTWTRTCGPAPTWTSSAWCLTSQTMPCSPARTRSHTLSRRPMARTGTESPPTC